MGLSTRFYRLFASLRNKLLLAGIPKRNQKISSRKEEASQPTPITFSEILAEVLTLEGGFSNHRHDAGGPTRYGITESSARNIGYQGSIQDLPLSVAQSIYRSRYWKPIQGDKLLAFCPDVAREVFECSVICGTYRASCILQRSLNLMNQQESHYKDIKVDGKIGSLTIAALQNFFIYRGEEGAQSLLNSLNVLQGYLFIDLTEKHQINESFIYGWLKNRIVLRQFDSLG